MDRSCSSTNIYGVGYISLCRISFLPFECNADHPTIGLETMTHFPDSTCDEGEAITGIAVFGICVYVFGILSLYGAVAYVAPKKYRDETFRQSTGFLLNRWQPSIRLRFTMAGLNAVQGRLSP